MGYRGANPPLDTWSLMPDTSSTVPTVLVLLADGFEEIEAFAPIDLLRRAGVEVTVASLNENRHATGRSNVVAHADVALSAVGDRLFDLLFLPGGAGVKLLRADPRVRQAVDQHHAAGRWLAAICAAPTVLNDSGLLSGRKYTAHFSVANGLHLVALLVSPAKSSEISKAICF